MYYQRFLENLLDSNHKKIKYGITDITTKNEHIEIKNWNDYKAAMGQLISYNTCDEKEKLSVYFFGEMDENKKLEIIDLFKTHNISVKEFEINIKDLYIDNSQNFIIKKFLTDNFENGIKQDYVKLVDIKRLLKESTSIEIRDQDFLINIVKSVFNKTEFKINSRIGNTGTRNFFKFLKMKE